MPLSLLAGIKGGRAVLVPSATHRVIRSDIVALGTPYAFEADRMLISASRHNCIAGIFSGHDACLKCCGDNFQALVK